MYECTKCKVIYLDSKKCKICGRENLPKVTEKRIEFWREYPL